MEQSVSIYGSEEEAQAAATAAESEWRSCASNEVVQGSGEDSWTFNFSAVRSLGDVASVSMAAANIESGGRACQTAIGLRANVVVEAWACLWVESPIGTTTADPSAAGDTAEQLVAAMLAKVRV